ncbi:MAG: hypothetical protein J6T08_09100 [Lentisphaeria bacterium]|nr:hypothetical protein [Lentisphaeria bacterium]
MNNVTKEEKLNAIDTVLERMVAKMEELKAMKETVIAEAEAEAEQADSDNEEIKTHPMLGRKCIIRTYSAGVHFGKVTYVNPNNSMEVKLTDALRIWKWENGGLSLSAIANNGMKGGRVNYTGEIYLTNAIEYIPVTAKAEATFADYIEDKE